MITKDMKDRIKFYHKNRSEFAKAKLLLEYLDFCFTQDISGDHLEEFNKVYEMFERKIFWLNFEMSNL